jgi:hypothetical protein
VIVIATVVPRATATATRPYAACFFPAVVRFTDTSFEIPGSSCVTP